MTDLKDNKANLLLSRVTTLFAILYAVYHLYSAWMGPLPDIMQRSIHVSGAISLFYLSIIQFGDKKYLTTSINIILLILAILSSLYIIINYNNLMSPMYMPDGIDIFFAIVTIIVVLETSRRLIGWFIPAFSIFLMIYAYFGDWFPGVWRHNGISLEYMTEVIFLSTRGIYGTITEISTSVIIMFVIFGGLLFATGGGNTFMDLASRLTARSKGGGAKVAVVASGFFGMINGSAAANVASTGAFTIPLMKRLGYKPEFAAGVESSGSTGGQITPPIMGAGAFIMAEMLGVPYTEIMLAAIIPALLFYYGALVAVDFEARKKNYVGIPLNQVPSFKKILKWYKIVPVFLPIITLLYFFMAGYTPAGSAIRSILVLVIIYLLMDIRNIKTQLFTLIKGLAESSKSMMSIVALIASAQIILAMISTTGVGVVFSNIIIGFGQENLILAGIFAMVGTMIIGMGLPTVGAYILAAAVISPALIRLGLDPIAAHFFVFYFAIFAGITPPVCGTVFVAAGMAKSNWIKSAWVAMRLSAAAFFVPFMFLFSSSLLLIGSWEEILIATVSVALGLILLAAGLMGYYLTNVNWYERIIASLGGILLIVPEMWTNIAGIFIFISITLIQWLKKRKWDSFEEKNTTQI